MKITIKILLVITIIGTHSVSETLWAANYSGAPAFKEVWGYLMRGEENRVTGNEPFTDIAVFSAAVTGRGVLSAPFGPPQLEFKSGIVPRYHIVITELSNQSLMRFVLDPSLLFRDRLVADIAAAAGPFSGVQIDFEAIYPADALWFHEFLRLLKKELGQKTLSVAVPARQGKTTDAWDYEVIGSIADRVVVMAYDQHWSTSSPGPVASKQWAEKVAAYARVTIPPEKLIMGLPLYGRAWQDKRHDRALRFQHVEELLNRIGVTPVFDSDRGFSFDFEETVRIFVYYEGVASILEKLNLYNSIGVRSVAFWRIGQNCDSLWAQSIFVNGNRGAE